MNRKVSKTIQLGIIGFSEGNGHPYSWAAICNGYDSLMMSQCPFPVILEYLAKQSFPEDAISYAKVTHIWTQDKNLSRHIAQSSNIPHIVEHYEDMIGVVDAVLLARDDPESHLPMSLPFINAGVPIYIDKPIATDIKTLESILEHEKYPGQIFSCSALRYAKEFNLTEIELNELGTIEYIEASINKSWEKYGVHIIEPVLNLFDLSSEKAKIAAIKQNDIQSVFAHWPDLLIKFSTLGRLPTPIVIRLYGTKGFKEIQFENTFAAFKMAIEMFIEGFISKKYMITHNQMKNIVTLIEKGNSCI
ncbi:Gfo/Idh/MocA family oxidoreductase [Legionella impletisoli]|uniref:Gfo/Idh/MocA-like oxidoreductase N-terminal domain-containing protein n=1 Tax=Legionella impletisoli TaxID=343510 RepID=A0A917NAB2_9GAMM|nr:Gfo/Idh/MocA family oxidoreductase [Legionella impletisoli]GGI82167.1 hypothetical protein GCM10007966_08410 [Legionella impletisoli]